MRISSLIPAILACVCGLASGPAATQSPNAAATLSAEADALVDRYRQIIVLMDDEAALDAATRERARMVGKILFHQQLEIRDRLSRQLQAEIRGALAAQTTAVQTNAFLDRLEQDANYHDADKLAFRELVSDLVAVAQDVAPANDASRRLAARLDEDRRALDSIQSLYESELKKVFAALDKRGLPVRREAWDKYSAFVHTRYRREAILKAFDSELSGLDEGRGGGAVSESAIETFGRQLPAKTLLLTFDDGPHPRYTDRILEILKRYGLTGVFFEVGQNVGSVDTDGNIKYDPRAQVSRRILAAGSILANHSYTHANLPKLSEPDLDREIDQTETLLKSINSPAPPLFRPPYGARTYKILNTLQGKNLRSIQWNIDSEDWADPIAASVADRVLKEVEVQGRGIILFHDIHDRAVDALPTIIDTLQARGYQFASWNGSDFSVPSAAADAATRSNPSTAATTATAQNAPYRESWAVIIGIDGYAKWPQLKYAVHDAQGVKDLLISRYAFKDDHVFTLFDQDATREDILSLLGDKLGNPELVKHDDRVFVFYAGHGATRHLASGRDLGYIIPVDADLENFQGRAISMTNFQDIAEAIPAKHVLFVMDSCYSGLGLTRGGGAASGQNYLQEISRRTARQMFTAGGADQQVADSGPNGHSIFTWTLLRALSGEGDLNGDGVITASELAAWSGPMVSSLSHQTPAFGNLPGSEGGEFVFELNKVGAPFNELSQQLDSDANQLSTELKQLRDEIAKKSQRNSALAQQLADARKALQHLEARSDTTRSAADAETAIQHNEKGMVYFRDADYPRALSEFLAAAQIDPAYALAANNVGFVYFRLGQYQDAADWYERTIRIDPQRAVAWLNAGDAYLQLKRNDDARQAYSKYLELYPTSKSADYAREKLAGLAPKPAEPQ